MYDNETLAIIPNINRQRLTRTPPPTRMKFPSLEGYHAVYEGYRDLENPPTFHYRIFELVAYCRDAGVAWYDEVTDV